MQENVTASGSPRLLTVKEAAERLRTSPATLYALCASGALEYVRLSTHAIRIRDEALAQFVRRRTRA